MPKMTFPKNDPEPGGMPKQVVLACFEPVVARFGPPKVPNALKMGRFGTKKWVKNGSKTRFSKSDPGPFGVHKQVN